jgi:hypothetical protein
MLVYRFAPSYSYHPSLTRTVSPRSPGAFRRPFSGFIHKLSQLGWQKVKVQRYSELRYCIGIMVYLSSCLLFSPSPSIAYSKFGGAAAFRTPASASARRESLHPLSPSSGRSLRHTSVSQLQFSSYYMRQHLERARYDLRTLGTIVDEFACVSCKRCG